MHRPAKHCELLLSLITNIATENPASVQSNANFEFSVRALAGRGRLSSVPTPWSPCLCGELAEKKPHHGGAEITERHFPDRLLRRLPLTLVTGHCAPTTKKRIAA